MKVNQLINILSQLDPDLEVTDGTGALYEVDVLPAWYDGCYVKLKIDNDDEIIGAKIESEGHKVKMSFHHIETLAWSEESLKEGFFEYTNTSINYAKATVERYQKEAKEIRLEILNEG
jgi:hypothetical protein